jgi:hypothetical protein
MSKHTASAAGAAMPAEVHKSRRALLRLFGAAPALAILPVGSALALASTASPAHPDAALFAMGPAIDAADELLEAALDALKPAEETLFDKEPAYPEKPETILSDEDRRACDVLAATTVRNRLTPSPAWAAYEQAVQDHEREVERLKAECGVTAAEELEAAAAEATGAAVQAVIETPATTLAGLIFKARYAATHTSDEYDEDVMISIVDDLLAMADEGEGFADV